MSWLSRLLLYLPVLFLIMIVYAGQRHDNARDTLRTAGRMTVKGFVYTLALIAVMFTLEWLFID